jgi:hypothetical protein
LSTNQRLDPLATHVLAVAVMGIGRYGQPWEGRVMWAVTITRELPLSFESSRLVQEEGVMDDRDVEILDWAAVHGFRLVQRELDTGQLAWVWLAARDGPQPTFLTRRQAITYMHTFLERALRADAR